MRATAVLNPLQDAVDVFQAIVLQAPNSTSFSTPTPLGQLLHRTSVKCHFGMTAARHLQAVMLPRGGSVQDRTRGPWHH